MNGLLWRVRYGVEVMRLWWRYGLTPGKRSREIIAPHYCEKCAAIPYNPDAAEGDVDYRPGPDWPPSLDEIAAWNDAQAVTP